ncbi:MAG: rRNA pseudouridine synthase [Clostridia bacterium]|nr:rRNA pseudouridine synthase [Clostridia bacterium]
MRINKFLASTGLASRRKSEEYVKQGRITVNGKVITDLAFDVSPKDKVELDGKTLGTAEHKYIMLHKPKGYITSTSDDKGRKTVMELIPEEYAGVKPVGRLDYDTEGLLLLTNDGELANKLTSPAAEITKTYHVKIEGKISESQLAVMRAGVVIDGIRLKKCKVQITEVGDNWTKLEVKITEGKNRQIRKMFDAVGVNVSFLKRVAIENLKLGGLSRGKTRELHADEIAYLMGL